ncbi:IS5/IS1182 family transposase, partial [Streptomyces sp. NPDC127051]
RAFARLKSWRATRRARCPTNRIGRTIQAIHTCGYSG